jgi:peroxiredoxin
MGRAYGAARPDDHEYANWAKRVTFLIDPEGTVRGAWEVRDLQTHIQEVLDTLAEAKG